MNHVFKAKKNKIFEILIINLLLLIPGIYLEQPFLLIIPAGVLLLEYLSSKRYVKLIMNAEIDMNSEGIDCNLVYEKINMKWSEIEHVRLTRESGELMLIIEGKDERKIIPIDMFDEQQVWQEFKKHVPQNIVEKIAIV